MLLCSRDAASVGDVLTNILLEDIAQHEEQARTRREDGQAGDASDEAGLYPPGLDYLISSGHLLLCGIASLSTQVRHLCGVTINC